MSSLTSRKNYKENDLTNIAYSYKLDPPEISPNRKSRIPLEKQYNDMTNNIKIFKEVKEDLIFSCNALCSQLKGEKYQKTGEELLVDEILNLILDPDLINTANYTNIITKISALYRNQIRHLLGNSQKNNESLNENSQNKNVAMIIEKLWILFIILLEKSIETERSKKEKEISKTVKEITGKFKQKIEIQDEEIGKIKISNEILTREITKLKEKIKNLESEKVFFISYFFLLKNYRKKFFMN